MHLREQDGKAKHAWGNGRISASAEQMEIVSRLEARSESAHVLCVVFPGTRFDSYSLGRRVCLPLKNSTSVWTEACRNNRKGVAMEKIGHVHQIFGPMTIVTFTKRSISWVGSFRSARLYRENQEEVTSQLQSLDLFQCSYRVLLKSTSAFLCFFLTSHFFMCFLCFLWPWSAFFPWFWGNNNKNGNFCTF